LSDIVDTEHGYSVSIPAATPRGQAVSIQTGERGGVHLMHAESPDLSELYFEVAAYPDVRDHAVLADGQRRFLTDQSADVEVTGTDKRVIGRFAGTGFDVRGTLQGRWKERRFLFVDGPSRTYRIVHDPRSPLNERVFASLRLHSRD
jgi:hypothetical protein